MLSNKFFLKNKKEFAQRRKGDRGQGTEKQNQIMESPKSMV